jgi:hypothetical protein
MELLKTCWFAGVVVSCNVTYFHIGILGVSRSQAWDQNLIGNICTLKVNPVAELRGAKILYWPLDLGVEDVNTWKWMRDKCVGWVDAIPNKIDRD